MAGYLRLRQICLVAPRLEPVISDIADIMGLSRANRIVSIVAPGGMGKTSVAVAAANKLRQEFDDGICFVELGLIEH